MTDPDELSVNRAVWTAANEQFTDAQAASAWEAEEITWGLFAVPESQLGVLGDVASVDVVELGCRTAYFSAWLARRGARPVGVDLTPAQLQTARRCQTRFGDQLPPHRGGSRPPAAGLRHVRAGPQRVRDECVVRTGRLAVGGGPRAATRRTARVPHQQCPRDAHGRRHPRLRAGPAASSPTGLCRTQWPGRGIEYHSSHGDWIRLLRGVGFDVDALHELYAPTGADSPDYYEIVTADSARS